MRIGRGGGKREEEGDEKEVGRVGTGLPHTTHFTLWICHCHCLVCAQEELDPRLNPPRSSLYISISMALVSQGRNTFYN